MDFLSYELMEFYFVFLIWFLPIVLQIKFFL